MSATATRTLGGDAGLSLVEPVSLGDRLAAATERHLREAGLDPRLEVIELRAHAIDLANQMLTGFPSPLLQASLDAVVTADGVIAVSPIFSGSYNGLFKQFFDAIDRDAFRAKPVLIAATGGTPGTRSRSSTRSVRCSCTCGRRWSRPASTRRPRTGARPRWRSTAASSTDRSGRHGARGGDDARAGAGAPRRVHGPVPFEDLRDPERLSRDRMISARPPTSSFVRPVTTLAG